ncbi:membrane protein [Mycobacterium phage ScoobyDoobyDoo]|nr:membrane protein [Mycobacterium phage ScoobyDoobyDoo]
MTSVVDFLVDKRLSQAARAANWFDVVGALGALVLVGLWVATRNTDFVLYGLLMWVVLHGLVSTQLAARRRSRSKAADEVVVAYRELRESQQYPSGSENTHGLRASIHPLDPGRGRTSHRATA